MASRWPQGSAKAVAGGHPRDIEWDPDLRWQDGASTYLVRFYLPGFKKDEFRVRVDPAGRLSLSGERPAGHVRVNRALQLPPTADLDRIAARFDGSVLSLTVPKVPVSAAEMVRERMAEAQAVMEMEKERASWDRGKVIAAAVTAFALGVIVTHKFFTARNA